MISLALHAVVLLSWPVYEATPPDSPPQPVVELTLLDQPAPPAEPTPEPEPDVAQAEREAEVATELEVPEADAIAFVFADLPAPDSDEDADGDVISAITDDTELALSARIVAPEAGEQAPQDVSAPASPTSIAVAAAVGDLAEAQQAAPKPVEETVAQQGQELAGVDTSQTPFANDGELAEAGGAVAFAQPQEEPQDASLWDGAGHAPAEVLAGFNGQVDKPVVDDPSIDRRGASGSDGGMASSSQAVIDDAQGATRARLRRANTPLGRYTQRVYSVVRKRWHKHQVELTPVQREVTVAFRIERKGRVDKVELETSSGDPMLDAIARASVPKRLGRFPAQLDQSHIRQEITFRYVP